MEVNHGNEQGEFQRGLSMAEFLEHYGIEEGCEETLVVSRWPQNFACPVCGAPASCSFRREGRLYWQCASCRHQCSVISGTIFESTKLPLTSWFLAMHLLTQSMNNVSALELGRHLVVLYKTGRLLKHRVVEVMRMREDTRQLTGRMESPMPTSAASSRAARRDVAPRTRCPSSPRC